MDERAILSLVNGQPTTLAYDLKYDAENRLESVTGAATASFTYDGDGKQVKAIVNGVTAVYVGGHYEVKNNVVSKYYFVGATRLAVRTDGTLRFLLGDHLGSSSVTTNASGAKTASALYKAFGETRFSSGTLYTDYKFTGQREEADLGIYYFKARWYDGSLGRFLSPDSIISGGVQGYDRYAYASNNPVRYNDPSGHSSGCGIAMDSRGGCKGSNWNGGNPNVGGGGNTPPPDPPANPSEDEMKKYITSFGLTLIGNWTGQILMNLWIALKIIGFHNLRFWLNGKTATLAFMGSRDTALNKYRGNTPGTTMELYANNTINPVINILHEFGHLVDNLWGDAFTTSLKYKEFTQDGAYLSGYEGPGTKYTSLPSSGQTDVRYIGLMNSKYEGQDAWQQRGGTPEWEDWADIFANAMIGNIDISSELGSQMSSFFYQMQTQMHTYQSINSGTGLAR